MNDRNGIRGSRKVYQVADDTPERQQRTLDALAAVATGSGLGDGDYIITGRIAIRDGKVVSSGYVYHIWESVR